MGSTKINGVGITVQTNSGVDNLYTQTNNNTIDFTNSIDSSFYTDHNIQNSSYNFEFEIPSYIEQNESIDLNVINSVGKIVFSSVDWIYLTVESIIAYDFKIWYLWEGISNAENNYDIFFDQYWAASLSISVFQLFYAVVLDKYLNVILQQNAFNSDWFRMMLHSKENALIWLYHPELSWHINDSNQFFSYFYSSMFDFIYFDKSNPEICILAHTLYIHFLILFLIILAFITVLFSFYGNSNTEENTIDADYLIANTTVEAEKEISSIDDYLGLLLIIAYVFGVFFFIGAWTNIVAQSTLMLSYYSVIILFLFILGMPTLVLYDLGIFFLAYLRGAGKSSNVISEAIFDYVACIIFYSRILAQWVRVILMLVTFLSISHYVSEFGLTNNIMITSEDQTNGMNELNTNFSSTYYILTVLPGKFLYWIYESVHTIFLVTSQFIAFVAIIFWLFLFLYTFFIIEKHEDFFSKKRIERKEKLKHIYNLKN